MTVNKFKYISSYLLILSVLVNLYSCMPSSSPRTSVGKTSTDSTDTNPGYTEPAFPFAETFIQEGSLQTQGNLSIPLTFSDSFLIRGKNLSQYIRKLSNTTKYCLVGKFNYVSTENEFLILSAKMKSHTDTVSKTTEYYLQVEPSNDVANQNDCLTYNLTNSLFANVTNPSAAFSLHQLCEDCSSAVSSSALKLFFSNGEQVPTIAMGSMSLSVSGDATGGSGSCVADSGCKARGFDCCLDSQCIKDGAVRPSAYSLPGFLTAQADVKVNPSHFVQYPDYYFICSSAPTTTAGSSGGSTGGPTGEQADYEAQVRLLEYSQLYNCLNKVDGEFSYCTLKVADASERIPDTFSSAESGHYDDVNFSSLNPNFINDFKNNIVKIVYANKTLYEVGKTPLNGASFVSGTLNDNITTSQSVQVTSALPSNAKDDSLYITYKIDGTCEKIGNTLARCTKTYIQDSSSTPLATTYHDTSLKYRLPKYANLTSGSNIVVKIGGLIVPEDITTWGRVVGDYSSSSEGSWVHNQIVFNASYRIYQGQSVEITYFVSDNVANLLGSKAAAQAQVNLMCQDCGTSNCNLKPELSESGSVVNYQCVYPTTSSATPPANQTVYVSNRNVPHRYYDKNGVSYDSDYSSAPEQELTSFSYKNNDLLKPSNLAALPTGFNEIYGSFSKTGTYVAKPAKLVSVKKNQSYDILVNDGAFSGCTNCGTDYYSTLQKIFPQNLGGQGGGYTPDRFNSSRVGSSSLYRGDDLLFGRACFVPATMLPWTHQPGATVQEQRQMRLTRQHFLFANGYARDWYGFDYGSLIGSYDGVNWFSIGNQRRIQTTGTKLFLAVNAYFGDVNVDSSFRVTVSETVPGANTIPEHDSNSDGAECQKSHYCATDNDCFKQLGFDYNCQNVSGLTTNVPQFDANGAETLGPLSKKLASIVGGTNGQAKRCVYRGRGAPCLPDLAQANGTTFNGTSLIGSLTCSPNNMCQPVASSTKFNDRIARFATSPSNLNSSLSVSNEFGISQSDLVGLGARILGRPFDFYGSKSAPLALKTNLNAESIPGVCVPGKEINNSLSMFDLNLKTSALVQESSDKIMGVGPTMAGSQSLKYLNACPATDAAGISMQIFDLPLTDAIVSQFAITQNLSSNLLNLSPLNSLGIYSSTNGSKISTIGYQKNSCLRAPGASCFSDFECAPSAQIASKAKTANLSALLNTAEEKFWEEDLVCGNPDFKTLQAGVQNPNYDVKKNVCCREFGKTMSVYTQTTTGSHEWCQGTSVKVAGVNTPIDSFTRYSRVHSGYDKMTCDVNEITSTKTFALSVVGATPSVRWQQILAQYKTLDTINQRTCCTQNWVRSFASENGGGHAFSRSKLQVLDKGVFKNISWNPQDTTIITDTPFECNVDNYANSSCEIRSLTPSEETKYLNWAASFELIGIPQVAIKTEDEIFQLVNETQLDNDVVKVPLAVVKLGDSSATPVTTPVTASNSDFTDGSNNRHFSAAAYSKFDLTAGGIKKIFSENEFNCCVPSNQEVPSGTTASQCCTGNLSNVNGPLRCCLPDFTDVTVYLNRYVSSEGRGLTDSAYDPATGYIKDPAAVKNLVAQKNLCCSGTTMTGVAIARLSIPIEGGGYRPPDQLSTTRRFTYRTDDVDNNSETGSVGAIFNEGIRWNNHVYCVPAGFGQ